MSGSSSLPLVVSIIALAISTSLTVVTINISSSQMKIAKRAYEDTKKQTELQTRAYITSVNSKLINFEVGKKPTIWISVKNVGLTPAIEVTTNGRLGLYHAEEKEPQYDQIGAFSLSPYMPQGTELTIQMYLDHEITIEDMTKYKSKNLILRVENVLTFKDIYGASQKYIVCLNGAYFPDTDTSNLPNCK
ncbi:hypothetical protein [Methylobacterium thuringiense]|uniref:hypothetical protein n=1 Tax=Methylobacterium thuringiense TaxID=1003091 RepID=UPI001EDD065F|nr:hypothetical protein [Methylobacterium thuringiense]